MFEPFKTMCCIHSLDGKEAEATIIDKVGDSSYIAKYKGIKCSAIHNPFVGRYFVDDKYGIIRDTAKARCVPER